MLIPNKFNGYLCDGTRKYNAGGGIGEAMLLGAAMGGGSAAITGGDPLKGALLGGLTGGAGAGIGGALGGAAPVVEAGTNMAPTIANATAMNATANAAATNAGLGSGTFGLGAQPFESGFSSVMPQASPGAPFSSMAPTVANAGAMNTAGLGSGTMGTGFTPTPTPGGIQSLMSSQATGTGASLPPTPSMSSFQQALNDPLQYIKENKFKMGAAGLAGAMGAAPDPYAPEEYDGPLKRFRLSKNFRPGGFAEGGIADLSASGYDRIVGEEPQYPMAMASGGMPNLGSYSDGGRMLRGPGDGMSDSIPASISGKRPARLADGEFVVPADVVSHLGNGSTDAGAKQLYSMMDKVRTARTGRKAQGREINPRRYIPA